MGQVRRICILLLLLAAGGAGAEADHFNVDLVIGWDGCYRPTEWTPLEISVATDLKDPFGGQVVFSGQQDGLNTLVIHHPIVVTRSAPLRLPLVAKLAFYSSQCSLSILDSRGRKAWSNDYEMFNFSDTRRKATPIGPKDLLIGTAGRRTFGLPRLAEQTVAMKNSERGQVYVKDKLPAMLPWDWTGYASLDLLVLWDPDWSLMNAHQHKAVRDWVANGGKLLLVLGANPLPPDSPLATMLPLKIDPPRKLSLGKLQGSPTPTTAQVDAWTLELRSSLWHKSDDTSVYVNGPVGFGQVAVLGLDPAQLPPTEAKTAPAAWQRWMSPLLSGPRQIELGTPDGSSTPGRNYYGRSGGSDPTRDATESVLGELFQIPELRPLSIWWIILLLALLAVLLGPVDYLVLKKLDRLPLTWITSAGVIALFTVGAYYGVQALRAGSMQVRAVSVVDTVQGAGAGPAAWRTCYYGIFAPASDDYRLESGGPGQWWSGIAPSRGGGYDYYERTTASRNIYCLQQDGMNMPVSVPINIWSMQCLLNESAVTAPPLRGRLQGQGESAVLTLTNAAGCPIRQGWVCWPDGRSTVLSSIPGGASQAVPCRDARRAGDLLKDSAFQARGCAQRSEAIDAYVKAGAVAAIAVYDLSDSAGLPCGVANKKYGVHHTQWARLVVLPEEQ